MRARLATIADLSDIVAFGKRVVATTNYAEFAYNAVLARRVVKQMMTQATSRVWVAEHQGRITGLLMGEVGPMPFTHHMAATDLIFVAEAGGDELLDAFIEWCKLRKVARIDMGVSAGPEREDAIKRMFAKHGFGYSGPMFHMNMLPEGENQ